MQKGAIFKLNDFKFKYMGKASGNEYAYYAAENNLFYKNIFYVRKEQPECFITDKSTKTQILSKKYPIGKRLYNIIDDLNELPGNYVQREVVSKIL